MCGGGGSKPPKVDTSFQDWSKEEALRARKEEEARQNRVDYGMDQIRAIFEGGKTRGSAVAAGGKYDPKKTYYNADGSVWTPEAQRKVTKKVKVVTPTPQQQVKDRVLVKATQQQAAKKAAPPPVQAAPAAKAPKGPDYSMLSPKQRAFAASLKAAIEKSGGRLSVPRKGASRGSTQGVYRDNSGDFRHTDEFLSKHKLYRDNSGDFRYQVDDRNAFRDNDGDVRYTRGPNAAPGEKGPSTKQLLPDPKITYRNVTTMEGLTAEQQFAEMLKSLTTAGTGKSYAGVDPILAARRKAQERFYLPQLDEQHDDAQEQLTYALVRAGLGASTTAGKRRHKLAEGFNRERAGVMADIDRDVAGAAGDYEQQRLQIESQLRASGDATAATDAALRGVATFAQDAPELRPLENALLGLTSGIGAAKNAYDVAQIRQRARGGGGTVNRDLSRTVGA